MVVELTKSNLSLADTLLAPLGAFQPMCVAVLTGVYPGRVFLDDPKSPRVAFLSTSLDPQGAWCFLAGDAGQDEFRHTLNRMLHERKVIGKETTDIILSAWPDDWQGRLKEIFHPWEVIPLPRRHYVAKRLDFNWKSLLLSSYRLIPLDVLLLQRGWVLPAQVQETLRKWETHSIRDDFGFVLAKGKEVCAWVTVDFVTWRQGDIGFFVMERHRRRGLATAAAAAAIEEALRRGLVEIHWTCAQSNSYSIRIAETLSLERQRDYQAYWVELGE
jgi:RimJ/RimL family protein N-acetyltransferase